MTLPILIAVVLGTLVGMFIVPESLYPLTEQALGWSLFALILLVGIDLGLNRHVFKDLKKHGLIILIIPLSVIAGSFFGGVLVSMVYGMPLNKASAVAAGYGWYSLSGILLTKLDGPELGTIAFLTNTFRELIAIVTIPIIAKRMNVYTTIAPAGAAAMDSVLPVIARCTTPEVAAISFVSGAILSSLVPILVPFFYGM